MALHRPAYIADRKPRSPGLARQEEKREQEPGLPPHRNPTKNKRRHIGRGCAHTTPAIGWVAGQLGETTLDCAEGDAFTGPVGLVEDVDRDR